MENKHQVHNLIILDESGSMESIKKFIINGFNELIQTMKGIQKEFPEQEHFISLISFNGIGKKILHFIDPVDKINEINSKTYNPDASTPLFDALGFAMNKLDQHLANLKDYNVLVSILTDGEENASKEYTKQMIRNMINERKERNWTFTYIGTEHDIESFANDISISNHYTFSKTVNSVNSMFSKEKEARMRYSHKIRYNVDVNDKFYDED